MLFIWIIETPVLSNYHIFKIIYLVNSYRKLVRGSSELKKNVQIQNVWLLKNGNLLWNGESSIGA